MSEADKLAFMEELWAILATFVDGAWGESSEQILLGIRRPEAAMPVTRGGKDSLDCTPAAGWEKGQVENQVGLVRERFFTPRLRFASYEEMNAWLLDRCWSTPVARASSRFLRAS